MNNKTRPNPTSRATAVTPVAQTTQPARNVRAISASDNDTKRVAAVDTKSDGVKTPTAPSSSSVLPRGSGQTSDANDSNLFGFLNEDDTVNITPGQGMPKNFVHGKSTRTWKAMPVGPLGADGKVEGSDDFDPDMDDAILLPPNITLDDLRAADAREKALRGIIERKPANSRTNGKPGLMSMIRPPPAREGKYKPDGSIPFGVSEQYWEASFNQNSPYLSEVDPGKMSAEINKNTVYGGINTDSALQLDDGWNIPILDSKGKPSNCYGTSALDVSTF